MVELLLSIALAAEPVFLRQGEAYQLSTEIVDPRWFLLQAVALDYENPLPCPSAGRCDVPIRYAWTELADLRGRRSLEPSQIPALSSAGTHRLLAAAGEPPEPDPTQPGLREIVVRSDDSYVGYASELIGVPFVLNPTRLPDGRHQTDARLGADCVALVIYGQRRLGRQVPYVAPRALSRWADPVEGPVREGDVLDFGFQTAILAEDRGRLGEVDDDDRVLQTWHGLASWERFGDLPYHEAPLVVRRWREGAAEPDR